MLPLQELIASPKAEFVAIYGRRRIRKMYLVKNVYAEHTSFEFTGTQNATLKNQLFNTLVTTYPVKHSPASIGQIDQVITMDSLFKYESFD